MKSILLAAVIVALPMVVSAQSALDVQSLRASPAATVAELDMGKLKGEPSRLAWSEDGRQFYVRTTENRGKPNEKNRHYLFSLDGKRQDVGAEPPWAAGYWDAKSGQAPKDNPALKIQVKTETRQQRTTSAPMGGEMARGGVDAGQMGTSAGDASAAAFSAQAATVHAMILKGQTIGEFVNSVIVPGLTFGWGPAGSKVIAFAAPKDGTLVVMDFDGKTRELDGTKDALLPAWSADGSRLAWLQKDGRRKYLLKVADVGTT